MKFLIISLFLAIAIITINGAPTTVVPEVSGDAQDDATGTPQADEPVTSVPATDVPVVQDGLVHFDDVNVKSEAEEVKPTNAPDDKESNVV